MKKIIKLITCSLLLFISFVVKAQVLYNETFNSYPVGNFGTDLTGTIPAQGGWYTKDEEFLDSNTNYQIVSKSSNNQDKYLHLGLGSTNNVVSNGYTVFRNDIKSFFQQRLTGNNVLKVSFDIFTQEANDMSAAVWFSNETVDLFRAIYYVPSRAIGFTIPRDRGKTPTSTFSFSLRYNNGSNVVLPVNTWVTIEVYIDYDNSEIYLSLPLQNYTIKQKLDYELLLGGIDNEGNPLPDDSPIKLRFLGHGGINQDPKKKNPFRLRVDNINISAQNTVPTENLSVNEQLAAKFNLYPNPVTNLVNITNSENVLVEQITVYDISGKQLSTQTYNNETEIQLNVENLANGTYMLHLQTNEGTAVKKLIKK